MTDPFAPPSGDPQQPQQPQQPPVYGTPPPPPPYGAPQYGAPQYGGPVAGPQRNGLGTAALVVGILSILTFWSFAGGIVLGILGLVFGIIGRKRARNGEANNGGMALAGAITGGLGLLFTIIYIVAIALFLNSDSGKKLRDCLDDAGSDRGAQTQCQVEFQNDLSD